MKKLNIALIGQGRSGRDIHGRFFKSDMNTKYNVVAVVDAIPGRRERAAKEYGCDVYADYTELFGRTDIDLVLNSTFSIQHPGISIDLLNHGFNVVCEKPFAKTYEDGCRAILAAEKNGKMLNVFQNSRLNPWFLKLKEVLSQGHLGRIVEINAAYNNFARRWDWQTSLAMGGGGVRNSGPHPIDQTLDLLGFPDDIQVFSKLDCVNTFGDAEDYAKIILTAPGKPLAEIDVSSCNCFDDFKFLISGQYGCLRATPKKIEIRYYDPEKAPEQKQILTPLANEEGLPIYCGEKLEWTQETYDIEGDASLQAVCNYYDMIYENLLNGKEMEIKPEQVLKQLKIIDLVHAQNPLAPKAE